ncbi:MAG: phosphoenolpyruvate carboxykinase (ATP), partial [Acidobacteria bacterium]|nr:phosphoenolpyruvate carboxykinase (ATP) [Acidobacteriota bacterium]
PSPPPPAPAGRGGPPPRGAPAPPPPPPPPPHGSRVWLVNTGWTGGAYGTGARMRISHTRAMINAALSGALDDVPYQTDARFGVDVPRSCPGVPADVLIPRDTWASGADYDAQAGRLAVMFTENFERFAAQAEPGIKAAGPRV